MDEALHVKNGVMGLRQAVERQHAEYGAESGPQDRKLESHGNKRGPAVERTPSDVLRVADCCSPVLETKTAQTTSKTTEKRDEGHHVALQPHGMSKAFHGERRIGVHAVITSLARFLYGVNKLLGSIELRHHAIDVGTMMFHYFSSSDVSATSSRISAMEIAGRTRTNRKSNMTNMPIVPMSVAQSQNVGR